MRHRCTCETSPAWKDYGGRGITFYVGWIDDPAAFITHVGPRPSPEHEIDRIENDKGYEPGNVRWTTRPRNDRNRRSNHILEFQGQRRVLADWCAELELPTDTVLKRLNAGWTVERTLTTPVRKKLRTRPRPIPQRVP